MQYIKHIQAFLSDTESSIIADLLLNNAEADKSQVESWKVLIRDLKASSINQLPYGTTISIEYSLPVDGLAIDTLIVGQDNNGRKHAFIIESKQWGDSNVNVFEFGESRSETQTLHPQIQVSRHKLAFKDYLNIGEDYDVHPFVFMRNLSSYGVQILPQKNPQLGTKNIHVYNDLETIFGYIRKTLVQTDNDFISELQNAHYKPSKSIISAMHSIVSNREPFILTDEQKDVVNKIFDAFNNGKKIVRVTGAAGSGKTAILLHAYIKLLNESSDEKRAIFISGAQNTKLYQSLFREVERSFTFSFSLKNMVGKTIGYKYYICMDEAQHNQEGIITDMINRGAHLLLCYDVGQTINANNSLRELTGLENRDDFVSIELMNSVRFSGSQVFENNVKKLLNGNTNFEKDDKFDFQVFDTIEDLENHTKKIISENPKCTVAVAGLLSKNANDIANRPHSQIFIDWGNAGETKWIPYIEEKNYLSKHGGKLWVGTWWLPGLDVDYISVLVGNDAKLTIRGLEVDLTGVMQYKMMYSIIDKLNCPKSLYVYKKAFGKEVTDNKFTTENIFRYMDANPIVKEKFLDEFTKLIKNNYYILLTRARKGCFVCFSNQ